MAKDDYYYWFGSYWQILVMIGFLLTIWCKKSCSGISLRSQVLYALVFTTRHQDLTTSDIPVVNIILKITYLVVTYSTVLSILMYFQKTYEKQNDRMRIDIWIVACFLLSLFLVDRFDFLEVFTAFSVYLEAIAMIPQFQLIIKNGRIDKHVILYLAAMGVYAILYVAFMGHQYRVSSRGYRYHFRVAAAVIQLLLYCDFFYHTYPLLSAQNDDNQAKTPSCGFIRKMQSMLCSQKQKDVEAHVEEEIPKSTGHFTENVSNVVLSPPTFARVRTDKENQEIEDETRK